MRKGALPVEKACTRFNTLTETWRFDRFFVGFKSGL